MSEPAVRIMSNTADNPDDAVMGGGEDGDEVIDETAIAEQPFENIADDALQEDKPATHSLTFLE